MMRSLLLPLPLLGSLAACTGDDKQRNPAPADTDTTVDDDDDGAADTDADSDDESLVGAHDGVYTATMQRTGDHFGIGKVTVARNELVANFISNDALDVTVEARVEPDGTIVPLWIDATVGTEIEVVEAHIQGGILEATYTINGDEGLLVGTLDGALIDQTPVGDYDGSYALSMVRAGEEVAAAVLDIKRGAFETNITNIEMQAFDVVGFVTSDGVLVLSERSSSSVIAEASIDQDSGDIEGIYRAGELVGRIYGERSD